MNKNELLHAIAKEANARSKAQMVEKAIRSIKSVTISTNGQKRLFSLIEDVWKWFEFIVMGLEKRYIKK